MSRYHNGWFKFERRCAFEDIGQKGDEMLGFWVRLLSMANVFPTRIVWNGEPRELLPGQLVTGLRELAGSDTQAVVSSTRRKLDFLEKRHTIRTETSTRGTIITICNWARYNPLSLGSDTQTTHEPTTYKESTIRQLNNPLGATTLRVVDNLGAGTGCSLCYGTGTLRRVLRADQLPYDFRCSCPIGRKAGSDRWPIWSATYEADFLPPEERLA